MGRDGCVRCKDAGRVDSSAIDATEDAAARVPSAFQRPVLSVLVAPSPQASPPPWGRRKFLWTERAGNPLRAWYFWRRPVETWPEKACTRLHSPPDLV